MDIVAKRIGPGKAVVHTGAETPVYLALSQLGFVVH